MKSIVDEVLNKQGNTPSKTTQTIHARNIVNPSVSYNQKTSENVSLTGIKRPNYQRMKKEERLTVLKQTPVSTQKVQNQTSYQKPSNFDKDLHSKLSVMSLVQGKVEKQGYRPSVHHTNKTQKPKLLGKTKDRSYVWFFPSVSEQMAQKFKRSPNGGAVGVITSKVCFPSQLLIVNDVMRENPEVKYHLTWDRTGNEMFVWELYDQDAERLEKKLQAIMQILHRKDAKIVDSYTMMAPSAWLSKQLNIGTSVEAISVLEGIPYYASLLLLEEYFSSNENIQFQYEVENNYLILSGPHNVVSKVIQEFKRKADTLL